MPHLSEMTKEKRADRREARKNRPCPHDWRSDGDVQRCRICESWTYGGGVVMPAASLPK